MNQDMFAGFCQDQRVHGMAEVRSLPGARNLSSARRHVGPCRSHAGLMPSRLQFTVLGSAVTPGCPFTVIGTMSHECHSPIRE